MLYNELRTHPHSSCLIVLIASKIIVYCRPVIRFPGIFYHGKNREEMVEIRMVMIRSSWTKDVKRFCLYAINYCSIDTMGHSCAIRFLERTRARLELGLFLDLLFQLLVTRERDSRCFCSEFQVGSGPRSSRRTNLVSSHVRHPYAPFLQLCESRKVGQVSHSNIWAHSQNTSLGFSPWFHNNHKLN